MLKVITAYNNSYKPLIDISSSIITNYCNYHSFDYEAYKIPDNYIRPPSWSKIQYLITNLEEKKYQYILWIDADAIISGSSYDILSVIEPHRYIYISKDFNAINAGVILFANNSYNLDLLYKIWNKEEYINHSWWEQAALIELIDNNWNNVQDYIKYLPNKEFNAYPLEISSNSEYRSDDSSFITHFPSLPLELRITLMKKTANNYVPIYRNIPNLSALRHAKEFIRSWENMKRLSAEDGDKERNELCDLMLFRFMQNLRTSS